MSKLSDEVNVQCENCGAPETVAHFLHDCPEYDTEREVWRNEVLEVLYRRNLDTSILGISTLTGHISEDRGAAKELILFRDYVNSTKRL